MMMVMIIFLYFSSGLYMSDLTFLDNGNPNFHRDNLINFSKCRLIYHQIRDLILRQVINNYYYYIHSFILSLSL